MEIRHAGPEHQHDIFVLVRSDRLNPTGLHWQNFIVSIDEVGRLVGAVQLRHHRDGARELGSLVVALAWRGQGIAGRMIDALLANHVGPVHMITAAAFSGHYARWGFKPIEPRHAPRSVRCNHFVGRLARVLTWLKGLPPRRLVVLQRSGWR